jgi:hypothetical protein
MKEHTETSIQHRTCAGKTASVILTMENACNYNVVPELSLALLHLYLD